MLWQRQRTPTPTTKSVRQRVSHPASAQPAQERNKSGRVVDCITIFCLLGKLCFFPQKHSSNTAAKYRCTSSCLYTWVRTTTTTTAQGRQISYILLDGMMITNRIYRFRFYQFIAMIVDITGDDDDVMMIVPMHGKVK